MIRDKINRTKLEEVIPLNTPFVCHIEVTNICNFRCKFCASVDNPEMDKKEKGFMEYDLFCKIIDDLCAFEGGGEANFFSRYGRTTNAPENC